MTESVELLKNKNSRPHRKQIALLGMYVYKNSKTLKIKDLIIKNSGLFIYRSRMGFTYCLNHILTEYANRMRNFLIISAIIVILFITCKPGDLKDKTKDFEELILEFKISNTHRTYFTDASKGVFSGKEINLFLQKMEENSNPVCEMCWNKKPFDKKILYSYLKKEIFSKPPFDEFLKPGKLLAKLVSGCWNFFLLNDRYPERDFEKVKTLYPNERKRCYSVAFMQPYLMHSILNCETLTFIDTDWRVLYAHKQMIEKFQQNRFTSEKEVLKAMSEIKLTWLGNITPPRAVEKEINIDTFCKGQIKTCIDGLIKFQGKFNNLRSINFNLSYLHELEFTKDPGTLSVFFMSNAIDPTYTNSIQFKSFLDNIKLLLETEEKLVLMYHAGGRPLFGIYELKNIGNKFTVRAKCKDRYIDPPAFKDPQYYSSKLDYYLTEKISSPYCSAKQVSRL